MWVKSTSLLLIFLFLIGCTLSPREKRAKVRSDAYELWDMYYEMSDEKLCKYFFNEVNVENRLIIIILLNNKKYVGNLAKLFIYALDDHPVIVDEAIDLLNRNSILPLEFNLVSNCDYKVCKNWLKIFDNRLFRFIENSDVNFTYHVEKKESYSEVTIKFFDLEIESSTRADTSRIEKECRLAIKKWLVEKLDIEQQGLDEQHARDETEKKQKLTKVSRPNGEYEVTPQPGDTWTEPLTGMEFVWVEGGCYQMGQSEDEKKYLLNKLGREQYKSEGYSNELPQHEVCVDSFWMGKYEVTNHQFRLFKSVHKSKEYRGKSLNGGRQPVVDISWSDACAFAEWLSKNGSNFRLPTEAEWEYAARGGTTTARYWGKSTTESCRYENVADESGKKMESYWIVENCNDGYAVTSPVGKFLPNRIGLYDMLGNVMEWCLDVYKHDTYSKLSKNNPINKEDGWSRVVRGGSWRHAPRGVRVAHRHKERDDYSMHHIGFRLLKTQ